MIEKASDKNPEVNWVTGFRIPRPCRLFPISVEQSLIERGFRYRMERSEGILFDTYVLRFRAPIEWCKMFDMALTNALKPAEEQTPEPEPEPIDDNTGPILVGLVFVALVAFSVISAIVGG